MSSALNGNQEVDSDIDNHMLRSRVVQLRPPRVAMVLLVVAFASHWLIPVFGIEFFSSISAGIALVAIGLPVMLLGWRSFQIAGVEICPTSHTSQLLTGGIYRFSRNPMYLGMTVMLLGVGLGVGTLPFHLVPIIFFTTINFAFCPYEENKLEGLFGNDYADYRNSVRRWL